MPRSFVSVPNSWTGIQRTYQLPPYQQPNDHDFCLAEEAILMDTEIGQYGLESVCCPRGRKPYTQRPWVSMPAEGRRFKPIGVLPLPDLSNPANVGVPFVVMTEVIPIGYDGIITDVVCNLVAPSGTSTGFTEGSGDVLWRLSCNSRYIRDLGNVITSLGSLTAPNPVPRGGNRVLSNNVLEWTVTFGVNAFADLNPSLNVICSISGWNYPR